MLTDDSMFGNYYEKCQLRSFFGSGQPHLPAVCPRSLGLSRISVEKWIGLLTIFDSQRHMDHLHGYEF